MRNEQRQVRRIMALQGLQGQALQPVCGLHMTRTMQHVDVWCILRRLTVD